MARAKKQTGGKLFRVDVPILNRSIIVVYDCSEIEAEELIAAYRRENIKQPHQNHVALDVNAYTLGCVMLDGADTYLWVRETDGNASTVFHEMVHVAFALCDSCKIKYDEEFIAYLCGWLKKQICDRIYHGE